MGRALGAFDEDDDFDRPDLNKCPVCSAYFSSANCPICGTFCPVEMRAGNRPAVKQKKRRHRDSGRVTFVPWYETWWLMLLACLFFPIIGMILVWRSHAGKGWKIGLTALVLAMLVVNYGALDLILGAFSNPAHDITELPREEYIDKCEMVDPETFYRHADSYGDSFLALDLTVIESGVPDAYDFTYLICQANKDDLSFYFIVYDLVAEDVRFAVGDRLLVYGQPCRNNSYYDAPSLAMVYYDFLAES